MGRVARSRSATLLLSLHLSHSPYSYLHPIQLVHFPRSRTHAMRPSPLVSISSSCRLLARRPTSFNPSKDPLDIANTVGPNASSFDFPLTRPTLLKMEKQRQILHYLRLEQLQFKDLRMYLPLSL